MYIARQSVYTICSTTFARGGSSCYDLFFSPYLHNRVCSGETSHNPLLRFTPGLFTLEWTHRATFAWLQAWNQHNYDGHELACVFHSRLWCYYNVTHSSVSESFSSFNQAQWGLYKRRRGTPQDTVGLSKSFEHVHIVGIDLSLLHAEIIGAWFRLCRVQ